MNGVFEIFFGTMWTFITGIMTLGFYGDTGGTITVNGELVSQEEFNAMLMPKLFFGLFWVIGIGMIILGIYRFINSKNKKVYDPTKTRVFENGVEVIKESQKEIYTDSSVDSTIETSESNEEIIMVNGVKYKRID